MGLRDRIIAYGERRRVWRFDPPLGPIQEAMSWVWPSRTMTPNIGEIDTIQEQREKMIFSPPDVQASGWFRRALMWALATLSPELVLPQAFVLCMRHVASPNYSEAVRYTMWCNYLSGILDNFVPHHR